MRRPSRAALVCATAAGAAATLLGAGAGPASATTYPPPRITLQCPTADGEALHGTVCGLPSGMTTAPNSYAATVAVAKAGAAGATVTFAVTAGSLPPGLTLGAQTTGSGTAVTGNPTKAGTYDFTVKATDGGLTSTLAYQITVTVQGPPDQLQCTAAAGSFLIDGACVLPDAVLGQAYPGRLPTSHQAGGTLAVVAGSLPPGLSLPAAFGSAGAVFDGTPTAQGIEPTYSFTVQGTGDQGQPLYQAYQITVDQNLPLAIVLPSSGSTLTSGTVGQTFGQNFFLSGGAGPYSWSVVAGALPPGLTLRTFAAPTDADDELAGTPTAAGTYTFTMQLADYAGRQTTQQFTLSIEP
ncbi:putative Ig domain-containing protein [Actinospica durhamensis]|uniref:Ig domain-containing protein n=1 Tax=Actinospica durhamensis TaxID=1508375 RepID=A0A941EV75_9ACTN|nr:putative Ig domain-containing protein [Actinospica durhamensis]MBR7838757.1 putative Ig domain-containing protein [Actinospica durhamensis]